MYPEQKRMWRNCSESFFKKFNVINLINGYRNRGHLLPKQIPVRERDNIHLHLILKILVCRKMIWRQQLFRRDHSLVSGGEVKDIVAHMEQTYCASIGAEYKYIRTPEIVDWLEQKWRGAKILLLFPLKKRRILSKLNEAVAFENFIHTKFVGQKILTRRMWNTDPCFGRHHWKWCGTWH